MIPRPDCGSLFLFRLRCHGRQTAIRRVYDQRGSVVPLPGDRPNRTVVAGLTVDALETRLSSFDIRQRALENAVAESGISVAVIQISRENL